MAADDRDESFLARWSRLKSEPLAKPEPARRSDAHDVKSVAKASDASEGRKEKIDPAELPSIESLTGDSDFSVFLREGVPDSLRRQALRKLWVSDPVIAATDVLDVYNLDYFNMPSFPEGVKTLFRVGHGMLDEAGQEAEKKSTEQVPESSPETPLVAESSSRPDAEGVASQHPDGALPSETPKKLPEA